MGLVRGVKRLTCRAYCTSLGLLLSILLADMVLAKAQKPQSGGDNIQLRQLTTIGQPNKECVPRCAQARSRASFLALPLPRVSSKSLSDRILRCFYSDCRQLPHPCPWCLAPPSNGHSPRTCGLTLMASPSLSYSPSRLHYLLKPITGPPIAWASQTSVTVERATCGRWLSRNISAAVSRRGPPNHFYPGL